ncbi:MULTISPECIES: hypothetical protein [Vibrio]|uniref:hypothetical protein n=1 Tax=Vibrio TaxID=662 RepID=UPI001482095D|nr:MULTISPECIES: hypothetical protein [Vibrio]MDQ2166131.1 hypothetical protein [Vibrio anguillarum]NNN97535.1 hypothetical protein [Vibrio sp. B4-6]
MDIINSILVGSFAGASIVAFLAKVLVNHQFEKLKSKHLYELQVQQQKFKSDLDKENYEHSLKFSRHEQDRVAAIKELYSLIINLGDGISDICTVTNIKEAELNKATYLLGLSSIFTIFSSSFKNIHDSRKTLEKLSIYIDDDLEKDLTGSLDAIEKYYVQAFKRTQQLQKEVGNLSGELNSLNQPKDLEKFWFELTHNWEELVSPVKNKLKGVLRIKLGTKA